MNPTNEVIVEQQSNEVKVQTSHDMPMKMIHHDSEHTFEPNALPLSENTSLVKDQLDRYNENWKAVLAVDAVLKLLANGRLGAFTSILKTRSELCGKLYLAQSEMEMIHEENSLQEALSRMEEQMDGTIRELFPAKKNATPTNKLNSENILNLESQVAEQLETYKSSVRDRYNTAYLVKQLVKICYDSLEFPSSIGFSSSL